jgi:hypothetical protein
VSRACSSRQSCFLQGFKQIHGEGSTFLPCGPESRNRPTERERAEGREAVRAKRGRNPRSTSEAAARSLLATFRPSDAAGGAQDGGSPTRLKGKRTGLYSLQPSSFGRGTPENI